MFLEVGEKLNYPCKGASRMNLIPNKSRHTQCWAQGSWKAALLCGDALLFDRCWTRTDLTEAEVCNMKHLGGCVRECIKVEGHLVLLFNTGTDFNRYINGSWSRTSISVRELMTEDALNKREGSPVGCVYGQWWLEVWYNRLLILRVRLWVAGIFFSGHWNLSPNKNILLLLIG